MEIAFHIKGDQNFKVNKVTVEKMSTKVWHMHGTLASRYYESLGDLPFQLE